MLGSFTNDNMNDVPTLFTDFTLISLFIKDDNVLHRNNPNPVPDLLSDLVDSMTPNALNKFLSSSSVIPIPVSFTSTIAFSFSSYPLITIHPFIVNLRAFDIKLKSICLNRM